MKAIKIEDGKLIAEAIERAIKNQEFNNKIRFGLDLIERCKLAKNKFVWAETDFKTFIEKEKER